MSPTKLASQSRAMAVVVGAPIGSPSVPSSRRTSVSTTDEKSSEELPLSAYYIIVVEGCERFCSYGLRVLLLLYFIHYFNVNQNTATVYYHLFSFGCHSAPILGAILADGYIGRYFTILSLSILYFIGTLVLSLTTIPIKGQKYSTGPVLGLVLIAIGTGGIKSCVNAFGADQIPKSNSQQLKQLFTFFYFSINIGSLISTIITPLLRSEVQCFGYDCYPLAFGVLSFLMLLAIIVFVIGTSMYNRFPAIENYLAKFSFVIWRAIRNATFSSKSQPKEHYLDYADDKYSENDIKDVRSVLRATVLLLPLTVYQALQNQKGSRWTYQASLMSGSIEPFGTVKPEQMQLLSLILLLLFIPLFERVIYPAAARFGWLIEPLQRIFLGLILTAFAFVAAALLQETIRAKTHAVPVRYYTQIYNGYHCPIHINDTNIVEQEEIYQIPCTRLLDGELLMTSTCDKQTAYFKLSSDRLCPSAMIISESNGTASSTVMDITTLTNPISKTRGARDSALLRLVSFNDMGNITVSITPNKYVYNIENKLIPSEYQSVLEATYRVDTITSGQHPMNSFRVRATAVYTVLLVNTTENQLRTILFQDVPPFTVHMFWQAIQYILLTAAEVLVGITVLIFAYSEAPKQYKVVILSMWLLTSAFGDLLIILVAEVRLTENQAAEFLIFAIAMALTTVIFGVMAVNYESKNSFPLEDNEMDEPSEDQYLLKENSSSN